MLRRLLLAVALPLLLVAVAFVLWLLSDRLLYVGPLDRATFGWMVVIPIWALTPLGAAFAWRRLASPARRMAATICGLVVGSAAAWVFWQAVAFPVCDIAPVHQPVEWVLPAVVLGVVVGGGLGISALLASSRLEAGHPWHALLQGAAAQLAVVFASILLVTAFVFVFVSGGCQRP